MSFFSPDMPRRDDDESRERDFKEIDEFADADVLSPDEALMEKEERQRAEELGIEKDEENIWPSARQRTFTEENPVSRPNTSNQGSADSASRLAFQSSSELDTSKKELSWQLKKDNKTSKQIGKEKRK